MRALLRDAQDQTRIALEVEEVVYDPKDNKLILLCCLLRLSCEGAQSGVGLLPRRQ